MKKKVIFLILTSLCLLGNLSAQDRKKGADIIVQKKDGETIRGELLAVKNDGIILMDSLNHSGVELKSEGIQKITITKKGSFFKGLGLGLVIGGGSGAVLGLASGSDEPGFLSMRAGEKAALGGLGLGLLGALVGGVVGAIKGVDESVALEGRTPEEMERVLKKLNTKSRFPQAVPQIYQEIETDPMNNNKEEKLGEIDFKKSSGQKFSRIHISIRPSYFPSQGFTDTIDLFNKMGMGDTKPGGSIRFLWMDFGSYGPIEYPKTNRKSAIHFTDVQIDYSLNRTLALGAGYAPLGNHSVSGYKKILINVEGKTYYSDLFLNENCSGETYYLSASWMPIPDPFLKKVGIKLGISAGISNIKLDYATSKYGSFNSGGENIHFSKKGLVLMGLAELDYYLIKNLSIGISAEYRYVPVRIEGTQITGYYDNVNDNMELINSAMVLNIPEHKLSLGGFCYGINLGFHF